MKEFRLEIANDWGKANAADSPEYPTRPALLAASKGTAPHAPCGPGAKRSSQPIETASKFLGVADDGGKRANATGKGSTAPLGLRPTAQRGAGLAKGQLFDFDSAKGQLFDQVTSARAIAMQKAKMVSKNKLDSVKWINASSEREGPVARLARPQQAKPAAEERPGAPGTDAASSGAEK